MTVGRPAAEAGRLAGYIIIVQNVLRLMGSVRRDVRPPARRGAPEAGAGAGTSCKPQRDPRRSSTRSLPRRWSFPLTATSEEENVQRVLDHAAQFYEETWIHRPRKSLNRIAPVDAAGHPRLRRRLLGVIALLEQCAAHGILSGYDFNRLRHKLGLRRPGRAGRARLSRTAAARPTSAR